MLKQSTGLILFLLCLLLPAARAAAAPPGQAASGEAYTVQGGDWLTKIADKYYGDPQAYQPIIEATNTRAAADPSFAIIDNPDLIHVGQKLWIPRLQSANAIIVGDLSFEPVTIERLGLQAAVPQNWPPVADNDPFLRHGWSAGLFSFVRFNTMPGNDPLAGVARLLGVAREDLSNPSLGGKLTEARFGDRTWTLYTRAEGGVTTVAAATIQDKVIYQVSLSSESSQTETIQNTILGNFQITNPALNQQIITISAPSPGAVLTNPFELRGSTVQYPFRGNLIYRILDANGNQVGRGPFEVVGQLGASATFALPASYSVPADGPGTIEVAEISAADGAIIAIDSIGVMLLDDPDGFNITIDDPRPYASASSPVQIRGKTADRPFEGRLNYRIVDAAGQEIGTGVMESRGQVGQINSFDTFAEFSVSQNGPGRIEIFNIRPADGATFTIATVNVWLTTTPEQ
jgi:hypothetical protein